MSNDLMKKLEEKINEAIDTIELSRMEISELKDQKEELENRYVDWEKRLSALIDKFESLEDGTNLENKENLEESPIEEIEIENKESIIDEGIDEIEQDLEEEEVDKNSGDHSEQLDLNPENEDNPKDEEDENDSQEFLKEDISEENTADIDESDESVFGPNLDTYTESPESSQHYA